MTTVEINWELSVLSVSKLINVSSSFILARSWAFKKKDIWLFILLIHLNQPIKKCVKFFLVYFKSYNIEYKEIEISRDVLSINQRKCNEIETNCNNPWADELFAYRLQYPVAYRLLCQFYYQNK